MSMATTIAVVPLIFLALGLLVGFGAGRYLAPKAGAILLGLAVLIALVLIVRLVMVGPGDEEDAFIPFVGLNAAVFPVIFAGVMGWLGGRALLRRATA